MYFYVYKIYFYRFIFYLYARFEKSRGENVEMLPRYLGNFLKEIICCDF